MVTNVRILHQAGNFLSKWASTGVSRTYLIHVGSSANHSVNKTVTNTTFRNKRKMSVGRALGEKGTQLHNKRLKTTELQRLVWKVSQDDELTNSNKAARTTRQLRLTCGNKQKNVHKHKSQAHHVILAWFVSYGRRVCESPTKSDTSGMGNMLSPVFANLILTNVRAF